MNHASLRNEDKYFQRKATMGAPKAVTRYEDADGNLHASEEIALKANKEIRRKLAAVEFKSDFKELSGTSSDGFNRRGYDDNGIEYRKALTFMTDNPTEIIRMLQEFMRKSA